jgi:glutathione S-transferase
MKFFNSMGPNPRLVRMFAAEKGIELAETIEVDLVGGENRQAPYTDRNPAGQVPCLELDDGSTLAETVAICEYLEEVHPEKPLIGSTPEERAMTRMWTRRVESKVNAPLADGFRFAEGLPIFKDRIRTIPHAADDLKAIAQDGLKWFDDQLSGKDFIAGDRFTLADIVLFAFLDFGASVGQPLDPSLKNVNAWLERVKSRPSTEA